MSMRRRIYLITVIVTTVLTAAFAVPLLLLIHVNARAQGVTALRAQASYVAVAVAGRSDAEVADLLERIDGLRHTRTMVIRDGRTLGSLPGGVDPVDLAADSLESLPGIAPVSGGVLALGVDTANQVRAFAYSSGPDLVQGTGPDSLLVVALGLFSVVTAVGAGRYVARWTSSPLLATAVAARQLSGGRFTVRAPVGGPAEVREVSQALNLLADRIEELVEDERETVADLSHRLRTPLTALRLEVEAIDGVVAQRLGDRVEAVERTLTAIIDAARRAAREGVAPCCDAGDVVRARIAYWYPLAEDQGRRLDAAVPQRRVPVGLLDEDLAAAVDALVENVMAHTPEGAGVDITLRPLAGGGAEITVRDEGPGIPRGALVRGASTGSTGLGLSIAARYAETSGGGLQIESGSTGGAVRMTFGPPDPRGCAPADAPGADRFERDLTFD